MANCSVRWRPSGGRGEYEFVPSGALEGKEVSIEIDALGLTFPTEVYGVHAQGKPRLRKRDANNRSKLHLPPLIAAVARLPEPRREDVGEEVTFPLENKGYILEEITFDIIEDNDDVIVLRPLRMTVLNSTFEIDLQDRFTAIARDEANSEEIAARHPDLADALATHTKLVRSSVNSRNIRLAADRIIALQRSEFGPSNYGSITVLDEATKHPASETDEEIYGIEGRTLTRVHIYKERDRKLVKSAKRHFKTKWGRLKCEICDFEPHEKYGDRGDSCIEAHHKTPIEELLPDSVTRLTDLAMLCASCHRVLHSRKPALDFDEVVKP